MLSAKQSVIVQDYSQTRNNNELKTRQRSGRKQQKQTKKVNCWHKISRETDFRSREEVWFRARQNCRPRESVSSSREIGHQSLISLETEMVSRETEMVSRETNLISRETKRCRAKVQTSFADSEQF